jgi:hypothetical protein
MRPVLPWGKAGRENRSKAEIRAKSPYDFLNLTQFDINTPL